MKLIAFDELRVKGIPYSRAQIWRLEKSGKFPRHIKLGGGNRSAWLESELNNWISQRITERDAVTESEPAVA